ncbi:MAG: hypothetical protein JRH11_26425, partial [Deltaproteobacteria bacterium]|nr:hypothetical protein [Deltaproteobacteria bacterium]
GPVPIEDFATVGADVVCTQRAECCSSLFETRQEQIDRCASTVVPITRSVVEDLQLSIDAGRLAYDGDITGDCLRHLEALACGAVPADDPYGEGCEEGFVPLVMDGGACTEDVECLTGRCDVTSSGEDGSCVIKDAEGMDCRTGNCDDGLYCTTSGRTCRPKRVDGADCDSDRQCQSDACDDDVCVADTICN